jgi:predicted metalloprotease with PDZ domain
VGEDNWIVEGMAEYYSIEIMRRSGTLTQRRFEQALSMLERWGGQVESLRATRASGPIMAAAAVLMHRLDEEIKQATDGKHSLDEVVRQLMPDQRQLSLTVLRAASERVLGQPSAVLTKAFDA